MTPSITDIIFDFDGTLVDSAPGILASLGAVLRGRAIVPLLPLCPALIGPPLAETLMRLTGWGDAEGLGGLIDDFKGHYDTHGVLATPPFMGVEEMMLELVGQGVRLHIATNKRISVTRLILEHLGWTKHFASVYAVDRREPRYPSKAAMIRDLIVREGIDSGAACYVGDRLEDGVAADALPIPFVLAAWGYGEDDLPMRPHWRRVDRPQALTEGVVG